ncbi:hypothetical protein V6Z12_A06G124100 [Gossypium hirsutum]
MIQCLLKLWEAKVTAIEEVKNLETLSLDDLTKEKVEKKKLGIVLKSTPIEESESSDDVDEDKETTMFVRRFKRFMKSNKGRRLQKKERLKIESIKENDPIICYECKKLGHTKLDCPQWKKNGSRIKNSCNDEEHEVVNLYLMAIDESKVTFNLSNTYDELDLEFEIMVSKYKKNISKLKNENDLLSKAKYELGSKVNDI